MTGWCTGCGEARRGYRPCTSCGWPEPPVDLYFPSGSNHPGEIRGLLTSGRNVGITASELSDAAVQELLGWGRLMPGAFCFLDSGAFSEVTFGPGGPRVVKPIEHRDWQHRLDVARQLSRTWGDRLFVVTPDRVGDQRLTLDRLARYRRPLQALYRTGVNLVLPVQRGEWPMVAFWVGSLRALGLPDGAEWRRPYLVPGIPSKKDATPLRELREFADIRGEEALTRGRLLSATGQPPWLWWHLLGRGPRSRGYGARLAALYDAWPYSAICSDSVFLRAAVGRTNGVRGGARGLTTARDEVLAGEALDVDLSNATAVKAAAIERYLEQEEVRAVARAKRAGWRPEETPQSQLELGVPTRAEVLPGHSKRVIPERAACTSGRTPRQR